MNNYKIFNKRPKYGNIKQFKRHFKFYNKFLNFYGSRYYQNYSFFKNYNIFQILGQIKDIDNLSGLSTNLKDLIDVNLTKYAINAFYLCESSTEKRKIIRKCWEYRRRLENCKVDQRQLNFEIWKEVGESCPEEGKFYQFDDSWNIVTPKVPLTDEEKYSLYIDITSKATFEPLDDKKSKELDKKYSEVARKLSSKKNKEAEKNFLDFLKDYNKEIF